MRARVWATLESTDSRGLAGALNAALLGLIALNVTAVIVETVPWIHARWGWQLHVFELVSVAVFSVEYALRLWSCTTAPAYRDLGPVLGRLRFARSPSAIIDLVAVLPSFAPFLFGQLDGRVLRALRLVRLFRVFKAGRYAESIQALGRVIYSRRAELTMSAFMLMIALIVAASVMYYAEHEAQPDKFGSIPESAWWGIVTLTTIGYGDAVPVTALGKVCNAFIALLGIGLFGLPAGILASGFMEEIQRKAEQKRAGDAGGEPAAADAPARRCPHCGHDLPAEPLR